MPARPLGAPLLSINIENLHLHMDERMTLTTTVLVRSLMLKQTTGGGYRLR